MLLVDDLAAGGTKNLRHTPRGLVTLMSFIIGTRYCRILANLHYKKSKYHGAFGRRVACMLRGPKSSKICVCSIL